MSWWDENWAELHALQEDAEEATQVAREAALAAGEAMSASDYYIDHAGNEAADEAEFVA